MEVRRVEGAVLHTTSEQSQGIQTQRKGEELRIRLTSVVPEVLLTALTSGGANKATVLDTSGGRIRLLLENGYEILAENRTSVVLQKGDHVELSVENTNPFTLRVLSLDSTQRADVLLKNIMDGKGPINSLSDDVKTAIENSGLFYETKLKGLLTGRLSLQEVLSDAKAQILQELSKLVNLDKKSSAELIHLLKGITRDLQRTNQEVGILLMALDTLTLENLSHEDYVKLVKYLKEDPLISYLERKDIDKLVYRLLELVEEDKNLPNRDLFVKALTDLAELGEKTTDVKLKEMVKEFLASYKGIEKLYNYAGELREYLLSQNVEKLESLITKLEYITMAQYSLVNRGKIFLPIEYEEGKGGLIFDLRDSFKVIIHLNYPEYYITALITSPRRERRIEAVRVSLFTDNEELAKLFVSNRAYLESLLSEEGIRLVNFSVDFRSRQDNVNKVVEEIGEEGLHLAV